MRRRPPDIDSLSRPARETEDQWAFKFVVVSPDGDVFETFESNRPDWNPGDTVILDPARSYRVTASLPVERVAEFFDEPLYGVLEVGPTNRPPALLATSWHRPPHGIPRKLSSRRRGRAGRPASP